MTRANEKRGFTLVEVLAAMALLLILAGIVTRIFYATNQAVAKAKANSEIYQRARSVMDVIRADLEDAFVDQTGRFFYCGTCDIDRGVGLEYPNVPLGFNMGFPPLPAAPPGPSVATAVQDDTQILMFATTSKTHRLVHPVLDETGPPPVYQVMYYLRSDGALVRMVENLEVPDYSPDMLLPGETSGAPARSFWMRSDLATFYPYYAAPWRAGFQTSIESFENCARYQTCQVVGDSASGMLALPSYTAQDVNDYYVLGMGVRGITFRFYDSDPGTANWGDSWNVPAAAPWLWDRPRLPYAVHVTIDIESRTGQYAESFAELIYLGAR